MDDDKKLKELYDLGMIDEEEYKKNMLDISVLTDSGDNKGNNNDASLEIDFQKEMKIVPKTEKKPLEETIEETVERLKNNPIVRLIIYIVCLIIIIYCIV